MAKKIEKRRFIVHTHLGPEPTFATSPVKAISNVRFRIFGCVPDEDITKYWTVEEGR